MNKYKSKLQIIAYQHFKTYLKPRAKLTQKQNKRTQTNFDNYSCESSS